MKIAKQVVTRIKDKNGNEKNTIAEFENFYNKLYNTEERDLPSQKYLFQNTETKKISKTNKENLKKPIELFEIKKAIMQLENNKSPGSDGLTAEFYKTGFPLLGETMTSLYNYILRHGETLVERLHLIEMSHVKVYSANIAGLRDKSKR